MRSVLVFLFFSIYWAGLIIAHWQYYISSSTLLMFCFASTLLMFCFHHCFQIASLFLYPPQSWMCCGWERLCLQWYMRLQMGPSRPLLSSCWSPSLWVRPSSIVHWIQPSGFLSGCIPPHKLFAYCLSTVDRFDPIFLLEFTWILSIQLLSSHHGHNRKVKTWIQH